MMMQNCELSLPWGSVAWGEGQLGAWALLVSFTLDSESTRWILPLAGIFNRLSLAAAENEFPCCCHLLLKTPKEGPVAGGEIGRWVPTIWPSWGEEKPRFNLEQRSWYGLDLTEILSIAFADLSFWAALLSVDFWGDLQEETGRGQPLRAGGGTPLRDWKMEKRQRNVHRKDLAVVHTLYPYI